MSTIQRKGMLVLPSTGEGDNQNESPSFENESSSDSDLNENFEDTRYEATADDNTVCEEALQKLKDLFFRNNFNKLEIIQRKSGKNEVNHQMVSHLVLTDQKVKNLKPEDLSCENSRYLFESKLKVLAKTELNSNQIDTITISSSSSSSYSMSDSSSVDLSSDDNSSSCESMSESCHISDGIHNQKLENSLNNSMNSDIYDFNSDNESIISNLLVSSLRSQRSALSVTGNPLLLRPKISGKSRRQRPRIDDVNLNIPITDTDRQILLSMGKIKRQKQRPSVERLYNICKTKEKYPQFGTKDGIQSVLNDMINRQLLKKIINKTGLLSYMEINSAIHVVSITNPKRSRVKSRVKPTVQSTETNDNSINKMSAKSLPLTKTYSSVSSIEESIESVVLNPDIMPSSAQLLVEPSFHSTIPSSLLNWSQKSKLKCGMCGSAEGNDEMISCSLCRTSGHAICYLNCSPQVLKRIKKSSYWECPNCKKCHICGQKDIQLIICNVCDRGLHPNCVGLPDTFVVSNYVCDDCKPAFVTQELVSKYTCSSFLNI